MKYISAVGVRAPSCVNSLLQQQQQQGRISRSGFQFLVVPADRNHLVQLNLSKQLIYRSFTSKAHDQQMYDSQITVLSDMPLIESPNASFDRYMEDKPRVFKALVPDNRGTQRLNEEEWRIRLEPIGFLFLAVWPIVNIRLRCKTKGKEYPSGVPTHTSMVLEIKITKWDLEGITDGSNNKPSEFRLNMKGVIYPDREGGKSRIKGHFHMNLGFDPPPMLAVVMKNLLESMQHKVRNNLLADYAKFKKEICLLHKQTFH